MADQLIDVPPGYLASVITHLEMTSRPRPRAMAQAPLSLKRWTSVTPDNYRTLFRRVGEPWLWVSRLLLTDDALRAILDDDDIALYAVVDLHGVEVGMLELDFRVKGQCELGFLGLIPALNGKGYGRWLMGQALMLAWRKDVDRVWLHTCTLDHPAAIGFYLNSGFTAFKREVEIMKDPRCSGLYDADIAPKIPVIGD